jgi:hypothetical protein
LSHTVTSEALPHFPHASDGGSRNHFVFLRADARICEIEDSWGQKARLCTNPPLCFSPCYGLLSSPWAGWVDVTITPRATQSTGLYEELCPTLIAMFQKQLGGPNVTSLSAQEPFLGTRESHGVYPPCMALGLGSEFTRLYKLGSGKLSCLHFDSALILSPAGIYGAIKN